jgi:hypothetical protein
MLDRQIESTKTGPGRFFCILNSGHGLTLQTFGDSDRGRENAVNPIQADFNIALAELNPY